MTDEQHDRLWSAVCAVTAVYETYRADETARPQHGLFPVLDRLDKACAALTRISDELVPVPLSEVDNRNPTDPTERQ